MTQWVEALAAKPDDPSSIPETHVVEGINFYRLFSDFYSLAMMYLLL